MLIELFLLLAFHTRHMAGAEPVVVVDAGGVVHLGLPDAILDHEEVQGNLRSGLTTSFIHTVSFDDRAGEAHTAKALVDVYYEPWDRTWEVTTRSQEGEESYQFADYAGFVAWWRTADLRLLHLGQGQAPGDTLRVMVEVIPFSAAEQAGAKRWFVQSLQTAHAPGGEPSPVAAVLSGQSVFDMFLATSIKRRSLLTFRWKVAPTAS